MTREWNNGIININTDGVERGDFRADTVKYIKLGIHS